MAETELANSIFFAERTRKIVCLRQPGLKKAKNILSLSPPSGAPRRIGAVADEERGGVETDKLDEALKAATQVIERMLQA